MRAPRPRSRGARLATLAVVLVAVGAAAAGIARSTTGEPISDAQGVIHACYKKPIGPVNIVYSAANCGPGQQPLEWNQAGVQGPQGEPGPQGPQGPQGPPGADAGGVEFHTARFEATASSPPLRLDTERGVFLALPGPGTYWITTTGEVSSSGFPGQAICDLQLGADQERRRLSFVPNELHESFAFSDVRFVEAGGATVIAFCRDPVGSASHLHLTSIRIAALKVG
jgi:hypothetical protein